MLKWFAGLTAGFVVLCAGIGYLDKRPASSSFTLGWHPPRLCLVCDAQATRNAGGTYSLYSPGNPVVGGTTIGSSWANSTLADLATEITDSLSRSGKGGMLAALRGIDGTVASPAHSFTSEPGTGLYRIGAGDIGWSLLGTKKLELTASAFTVTPATTITGALTASSTLGVTGVTTLSDVLTQNLSGSGTAIAASFLEASLANGNSAQAFLGKAQSANNSLGFSFTPNVTAANSQGCIGVYGQNSVCMDGNNVVTTGSLKVGASGTAVQALVWNSCATGGGSSCTITVQSGAKCLCTVNGSVGNPICAASLSGTTLTLTASTTGVTLVALCVN